MHILGIYLFDGDESVIKNLKQNCWYPLYDLETFKEKPDTSNYTKQDYFYKLDNTDNSNISISCIVGQNGSGKSTLLDIIYRIINNFSWHIKNANKNITTKIYYAYGFHARLYYELNNQIGYIEIVANDMDETHSHDYINWNNKANVQYFIFKKFNLDRLSNFFYTIVTNYSLYSFTPEDYTYKTSYFNPTKESEKSFYPQGIFNKNDGYISPIVLLPYRDNKGIILTDNEKDLATQRIIALAIYLYKKHGTTLIEGKIPNCVEYSFNYDYDMEKDGYYEENKFAINNLSNHWEKYFNSELNHFTAEQREIILFYLGYKTFKLIKHYGFYSENASQTDEEKEEIINNFNEDRIKAIIDNDRTFMTLKIRQTCYFITTPFEDIEEGKLFIDKNFNFFDDTSTIDDYFLTLPPPFFKYDLRFVEKNIKHVQTDKDFSLNKMSSGEKQLLFNISYILYHLKNLSTKRNLPSGSAINATPVYKNAVLIFDEAELYMHPEFQRQYIYRIIKSIQDCRFENIKNIHIIFATHSPYLLSDVPSNNVLMLNDGKIQQPYFTSQTFSANIYDLLKYQFFMFSPIGEFARKRIQQIIQKFETNSEIQKEEMSSIENLIATIGDNYIRKTLESLLKEYKEKNQRSYK